MNRSAIALFFLILALSFLASSSALAVVYVKWDSPGPVLDGDSWETAYHTIQQGLNDANATKEEIWIAKGTYYERIALKLGVALYGGFAGTETDLSQRNWITNQTVIDGQSAGSVVTAPRGATETTRIDGFTIRNGNAWNTRYGGGIYCASSSPVISNNTITGNSAPTGGGGIYCYKSSPVVANNWITDNKAVYGAGVYCHSSSAEIQGNAVTGNAASQYGGAIYCSYASPSVTNNKMTGNTCYSGGGVYCSDSSPTIRRNVIAMNHGWVAGGVYCGRSSPTIAHNLIKGNGGGGVYCERASFPLIVNNIIAGNGGANPGGGIRCSLSSPTITNNTIVGNSSWCYGGGIYGYLSSSPKIANNIVAFNSTGINLLEGSPVLTHNCVYGNKGQDYDGVLAGAGDISYDPMLADKAYGNVHLQPGSPCVDAGWNDAPGVSTLDIDGQLRIQDGAVDIGADESDGTAWDPGPYVIIRVSPSGDDENDGMTWEHVKKTVQAGVYAASELGGEVWVRAGAYQGCVVLHPYAYLYGGFAGTEAARSERNWSQNETVLDGAQLGSVVTIECGLQASAIDGFTLRNGVSKYGGGIYCTLSSPDIANLTITNNSATCGGGMLCDCASPSIKCSRVIGNSASTHGGGLYLSGGWGSAVTRSVIMSNSAPFGGGLYCTDASAITNNVIAWNTATNRGGGISCDFFPTIAYNTIIGNTAPDGGAVDCAYYSSPSISSNILAFNSSGIYVDRDPSDYHSDYHLVIRDNCIYGNVNYDCFGPCQRTGGISADPLLGNLANGDFHLLPDSPCIDKGANETAPETDFDGNPRPADGDCDGIPIMDMGAYEYQPIRVQVDVLPGNPGNAIRLAPNKQIPVAILSTADFDARLIDPMSVVFGPGRTSEVHRRGHWEDVNRDGRTDLVLHFSCAQSGISPGDTSVTLYGRLMNRECITGSDVIRVLTR